MDIYIPSLCIREAWECNYGLSFHIDIVFILEVRSHMSGGLDGREKNSVQKLGHPMLVQPILSQKMEKSKFFNEPFFRNSPISIFPYVKLEVKWRKKGSLFAVNFLNLFRKGLNSLLNKHWHEPKALRIQSCSVHCKCAYKTLILRQKLSL